MTDEDDDKKCDKATDNQCGYNFCDEKDCPSKDADWGEGSMCKNDSKDDKDDDKSDDKEE